jgi:S-formylglutathione hydrolase FrmB/lysophospholipase L1-like esterase
VRDVVHYSHALGRNTTYTIVLPTTGDAPGTSLPVLYLLHGYSGNHRDWVDQTQLTDLVQKHQIIAVLPDGNYDSWWIDSPLLPQSRFATYLVEDLPAEVESRWGTRTDRAGRSIAGLSMGGHGATVTALRHPDRYASASSLSGILDLRVHPQKWGIPKVLPAGSRDTLRQYSFVGNLDKLTSTSYHNAPALLIDCGTSDTAAIEANRRAQEALTNRAIHHTYQEHPGTHSWEYWNTHLPTHVKFHETVRKGLDGQGPIVQAGRRPAERWRDYYSSRTLAYEAENEKIWIPISLDPQAPETSRPIVLLGSSTFEIKDIRDCLPGYTVAYRGISADRLGLGERGLLQRLYCSVIDLKPRAVFILNGTNDLGSLSNPAGPTMAQLHAVYEEIVVRILQSDQRVRVYTVSLSPVRDKYLHLVPKIAPFNDGVREIARRHAPRTVYVDQWSLLHDGEGILKPEYSRDGLHLNKKGYEHLGKVMREALVKDGIRPDN